MKYRKNVGMMIINADGLVFMAKRKHKSNNTNPKCWQMPQGGIDDNESPIDAVYREMMEEIGTNNVELIAESKNWYNYDFPAEVLKTNPMPFDGQTQKWFLFKFLGNDNDFNFTTDVQEFQDFMWSKIDTVPDMIVEFKADVYKKVVDEFKPIIQNLIKK